ncbi:MAG: PLP-dependent transferase, partial [Anaerolineae bacterium]
NPGDVVLHSEPSYGCTDFLLKSILTRFGIRPVGFKLSEGNAGLDAALKQPGVADKVKLIYIETPSNPSIAIGDIAYCAQVARRLSVGERRVMVAVDNTFLGPIYQKPIALGADIVLYSATKYIGGHSDLLAGAASGKQEDINQMKLYRAMLGPIPAPHTCWLLTRSLETMQLRMEKSAANAQKVAAFLATHPKVEKLHYLGNLKLGDAAYETYKKQCLGPGGMMAIEVINGEAGAFRFLNALNVFHQAVSLGGNESLAVHPKTTTHAEVDPEDRIEGGITDSLVRMSIGIENADDLIADLKQALDKV